ncbi:MULTISPECIES: FadR/GntR family transcriptional regulator [unclassified Isoptericola]|uniref:FadR/GntR family transcriptional regulator n=1 Tax=unclassified Isoptericola TaxID=2623355 RepID=UPI003660EFA0
MAESQSKPLRRSSLTDQATAALLELIQDRGLAPGDHLPPTNELAATFDVSVPVVREAVSGLAAMGVVRRQQGKESVISVPDASHLSLLLRFRVQHPDGDDDQVQEFREVVEVGNARLAASHADEASLADVRAALAHLRAVETEEELHTADVGFHAAVARAGKNDLLVLTLGALEPLLRRQREHVWRGWVQAGGDLQTIIEAHARILDRIEARDPEGAATAMADHLFHHARVVLPPAETD